MHDYHQHLMQRQAGWECFPNGKSGLLLIPAASLLQVFDALLMHSASLDLALQSGHIHESPKMLFDLLRGPVLEMGSWTGAVLQAAVDDFRGRKGTPSGKALHLPGTLCRMYARCTILVEHLRGEEWPGVSLRPASGANPRLQKSGWFDGRGTACLTITRVKRLKD
jgi:hypothetical protein